MKNRGAVCTRNVETAARYLDEGGAVATLFGRKNIFAMFTREEDQSYETLSRIKNRSKKPFFRVSHPDDDVIQMINTQTGYLHPKVPDASLELATKIMKTAVKEGPIGIVLPAHEKELHWGFRGVLPDRSGNEVMTVGYMLASTYDVDFGSLSRHMYHRHTGFLAGTSANPSGADESRGSGHHSFGGLVHDFGHHDDLCIYIPNGVDSGSGLSTSLLFMDLKGNIDMIRVGSISVRRMLSILQSCGVDPELVNTDKAKLIESYDYESHATSQRIRSLSEEVAHELSVQQDVFVHDLVAHFALRAAA